MYSVACFILALILAVPALAQVAPEAEGDSDNNSQMMTPPPVSDQSYPTEVGSEARSNYLRAGLRFSTSYIDNYETGSSNPIAETTYSILPMIAYDQTTPRQHRIFTYSPGFTFYEPSSALNEVDQSLKAAYQYRLTQHLTINASDSFQQSSASSGLADAIAGGTVSGSTQPVTPGIFAPFAERQTNTADAQLSYQFSPVGMVGFSGTWMKLSYPSPSEVPGLYNSDERSVSASYSRRISTEQYIGADYQAAWTLAYPSDSEIDTQTQTAYAFYTIYPNKNLSISVSGGPQYYNISETSSPSSGGWGPILITSGGWQGLHTNFAASYARQVTAGGGLLGAFKSDNASALASWQISHTWTTGASAKYTINKVATPLSSFAAENGHAIFGSATLDHTINEQFSLEFEYDRVHQSYSGITAINSNPNSDRGTISLVWRFMRPLGR